MFPRNVRTMRLLDSATLKTVVLRIQRRENLRLHIVKPVLNNVY
jgi:hypothetical protein